MNIHELILTIYYVVLCFLIPLNLIIIIVIGSIIKNSVEEVNNDCYTCKHFYEPDVCEVTCVGYETRESTLDE